MKTTVSLPLAAIALSFAFLGCATSQIAPGVSASSVADESAQQEALSAIQKIEASFEHRHNLSVVRIEHASGPTRQERQLASKPFEKTVEHWFMVCDGVPQTYEVSFWTMASGRMTYSVRLP